MVRSYLAAGEGDAEASGAADVSTEAQEPRNAASSGAPGTRAPPAATQLTVDGNIDATSFTGDGENLANVATDAELATHAGEANVHHTPPTSLPPSGAAGGDLTGTYPDPIVGPNAIGSTEITDGSLATGDLGFDPATQGELDTHAGLPNVHHTPTIDTDTTCLDAGVTCNFAASDSGWSRDLGNDGTLRGLGDRVLYDGSGRGAPDRRCDGAGR